MKIVFNKTKRAGWPPCLIRRNFHCDCSDEILLISEAPSLRLQSQNFSVRLTSELLKYDGKVGLVWYYDSAVRVRLSCRYKLGSDTSLSVSVHIVQSWTDLSVGS